MSLYGALYTGVSGLNAQGQKIGIISDNIANVNTVGYKQSKASFESLVVNAATTSSYNPGGVRSITVQDVNQQGNISTTSSPSDLAISGNGFFVVSARSDGSGQALYTRAGSFTQDSLGNYVNNNGFFLKGWPLDRAGDLPGAVGNLNTISSANLQSLSVVNVKAASGTALATSKVDLGINLNAGEKTYTGPKGIVTMDSNSANNFGIKSTDIIVPDEGYAPFVVGTPSFGLATPNNIARGDAITATLGTGVSYNYTYGGFTMGRNVGATGSANIGDGALDLSPNTAAAGALTTAAGPGATVITVDLTNAGFTLAQATAALSGLSIGDKFQLSSIASFDGIPTAALNRVQTITSINAGAGTMTFDVAALDPAGATAGGVSNAGGVPEGFSFRIFQGNVLDATSASGAFLGTTGTSGYTTAALKFTIGTPSSGTHTFAYTPGSPSALLGQFNNLTNLADAISQTNGLTARVVGGRLVVGSSDATEAVTFTNLDATGNGTLNGIDWVGELDLKNVASGTRRFSDMANLATLVKGDAGMTASIENPLGNSQLTIAGTDPLGTLQLTDFATAAQALAVGSVTVPAGPAGAQTVTLNIPASGLAVGDHLQISGMTAFGGFTAAELNKTFTITSVGVPGVNDVTISVTSAGVIAGGANIDGNWAKGNTGSLLAEFGLVKSLNGGAYVQGNTGILGPEYDSSGTVGKNMASGDITAQFSRTARIYDGLGTGHDVRFSYLKVDDNKWAVEVHAVNTSEINSTLVDGQIAVGTIEFNGDGTLRTVSTSLSSPVTINWTDGSVPETLSFNWGTAGQAVGTVGATNIGGTDGLSQFDSAYNVNFINQNGAPVGDLVSVAIDGDGYVIASYSNGETQKLYKIPLASFTNPDGLKSQSGNVYTQTTQSGEVNLREAGTNGTGKVVSSSLEQSNVDLATELTDMIIAQRAYQANTKVIKTSDDLLQQLTQLIQ